ncbi:Fic family protein [Actinokineospora sp.]|uniref:Fic family protein n=1 Tax=Actinokineospora sp. TaxID=1872133 RepID=UPI0040376E5F
MDLSRFTAPAFGVVTTTPISGWSFPHFEPAALSREVVVSPDTLIALSKADVALGRLTGVGRLIPNPAILVQPYLTREAVASSRIEGTEASLSDVFQAEASEAPTENEDIMEVMNYQRALRVGMSLLEELPVSLGLVRQVHAALLSGVRGEDKFPGEFRNRPVWIGSPTDSPETAAYVPPLPGTLQEHLKDWESFVNEDVRMPVLIKCAIMHYQFETIHPFLDGNGRIGRLLIMLMLLEQKVLELPLLYVSAYMEDNRQEYYSRLQSVRERGELQEWLQFFLTAVQRQAVDAETRAGKIIAIRERFRAELRGSKSRASEVVDLLFANPFVNVRRVENALRMTNQGARNLIDSLEKRGFVSRLGQVGRGGRIFWVADEIFAAVS